MSAQRMSQAGLELTIVCIQSDVTNRLNSADRETAAGFQPEEKSVNWLQCPSGFCLPRINR